LLLGQAVTERQKIRITSTVVKETQTVSFVNWNSQSTAAVQSEWNVTFQCNDLEGNCIGQYFELTLFRTSTGKKKIKTRRIFITF